MNFISQRKANPFFRPETRFMFIEDHANKSDFESWCQRTSTKVLYNVVLCL